MEKNVPHIDELIVKYLDGRTSAEEDAVLRDWRKLSPFNEKYFNDMQFIFGQSAGIKKNITVNTDAAWQRVNKKMHEASPTLNSGRFMWRVAASVAVLLVVSYAIFYAVNSSGNQSTVAITSGAHTVKKQLADGSQIKLQPNSHFISYGRGKREYALAGSATFTVIHNEKEPFIIHAKKLLIEDLGTVFSVNANEKSDSVFVHVASGSVRLYTGNQKGLVLGKGESGTYYHSTGRFIKLQQQAFEEVKLASMNFVNTSLYQVVDRMNRHFNANIQISDKRAGHCLITVRFTHSRMEDMLRIITETLGLKAVKMGEKIVLTGNGCAEE